jgi:hypothetical protein
LNKVQSRITRTEDIINNFQKIQIHTNKQDY